MEYHRNPSPPDSTSLSHDLTTSVDAQLPGNRSDAGTQDSAPSLADYDDCIGDTVFSKAWVLSILVKAVEAVKEQERKIEMSRHLEDDVRRDEITKEDERERISSNVPIQSPTSDKIEQEGAQGIGMESSECNQVEWNPDRGSTSVLEDGQGLSTESGDVTTNLEQHVSSNHGNLMELMDKELLSTERGVGVDNEQQEEGTTKREGERGEGSAKGAGEGEREDDSFVDQEDRPRESSSERMEDISESLENDLCRLWDASMNMVGL